MVVRSVRNFDKEIFRIQDKKLALSVQKAIHQLQNCRSLSELTQVKKMNYPGNYYRMRIGDYRLGFKAENDIILLLRFLHRKEIYKYFP